MQGRHGREGKARHRDRGLYRRGTSPPAPCFTLDLPASDPMASLPWLVLPWHEVRGGKVGQERVSLGVWERLGIGIGA